MRAFTWAAIVVIGMVVGTGQVHATEGTLRGMNGAQTVFLYKDTTARSEGFKLIQAGVHRTNPAMLMSLMACAVDSGTRAIITSVGFATHDVMIIEGAASGCRGNVAAEEFHRAR